MGVKCQTPVTLVPAWDANMHHFELYRFSTVKDLSYSGLKGKSNIPTPHEKDILVSPSSAAPSSSWEHFKSLSLKCQI